MGLTCHTYYFVEIKLGELVNLVSHAIKCRHETPSHNQETTHDLTRPPLMVGSKLALKYLIDEWCQNSIHYLLEHLQQTCQTAS